MRWLFVDPYESCLDHGGVSQLFWGLTLREGETGIRWCSEGAHMSEIAYLHWRFVYALLQRIH